MAPKRNRRRVRSGDTSVSAGKSSSSDSEKCHVSSSIRRSRRVKQVKGSESSSSSSTSIDSAYDGDGETTCSTHYTNSSSSSDQTMSSPSSDMFQFDEDEPAPCRGVLSPKQPRVKRKTSKPSKSSKLSTSRATKVKSSAKSEKSKRMACPVTCRSVTPVIAKAKLDSENRPIRKPKGMKTPGVSPILSCGLDSSADNSNKGNKRKMSNLANVTPIIATKSKIPRIDAIKDDSGFLSPSVLKAPRLIAKDTSTPSNINECPKTRVNDKCFGFDSVESRTSPMATSDYGSAVLDLSQISMDDSVPSVQKEFEVSMFSEPEMAPPDIPVNKSATTAYKPSRQRRPKGRYSTGKLEAWADKMNQEFEDADNFELSIEG